MASVTVKTVMTPGWEREIQQIPPVKGAVTKEANAIAARANNLSSGFRTKYFYNRQTKKRVGGTRPKYGMKAAKNFRDTSVAIVYTANYSAMKDNNKNNTLVKALK